MDTAQLLLDVCVVDEEDKFSFNDCSFDMKDMEVFRSHFRNNRLVISTNLLLT